MANEIEKAKQKELGVSDNQWKVIGKKTPKEHLFERPGRGGKKFTYVKTGYVIDCLNKIFNGMWDFEITQQNIDTQSKQIWVQGKLTCRISPEITITKTQYGGSDIKGIDIADDLKSASSDALKKCASLFGIASDLYWGGEVDDGLEKQSSSLSTLPPQSPSNGTTELATDAQVKFIYTLCTKKGKDGEKIKAAYHIASLNALTKKQAHDIIEKLQTFADVTDPDVTTPKMMSAEETQQLVDGIPF